MQNRVGELWATFDFLMPNFLGSHSSFSKSFGKPIEKGQRPGATAVAIGQAMEKLKHLHQQVLPFILRREKDQVLQDLPPKCITDVPCLLSPSQLTLYKSFCNGPEAKESLGSLQRAVDAVQGNSAERSASFGLESNVLRSLLYLRLICTHPKLVETKVGSTRDLAESAELKRSGKLLALHDLLQTAGICADDMTPADGDASTFYTDDAGDEESVDAATELISSTNDDIDVGTFPALAPKSKLSKCLIFAQYSQSLDVVENFLFKPHIQSLRYLRLDGTVPLEKRAEVVDTFNNDESIRVMLLTTRVGGLGLNLTGANKVIFLEHDYNPHADLQAMDRAHRLGQTKSVDVYRLISTDTIEEKIMALQRVKLQMSEAIVNSENSSMYSMGTDKLLDIFTFQSAGATASTKKRKRGKTDISHMDAFSADYESLSVNAFLKSFQ